MRLADTPIRLATELGHVLHSGKGVGLRCSIIARPTREEALLAARALVATAGTQFDDKGTEGTFLKRTDSVSIKAVHELADTEWLTRCLWTGAVRSHGAAAIALVGSSSEVASALLEFGSIGVSQFILSGWPKLGAMLFFGRHVLPLIREREHAAFVTKSA
jgi:alkanesulfonate monooxygenase